MGKRDSKNLSRPAVVQRVINRIHRRFRSRWRRIVKAKHIVFAFAGEVEPTDRADLRITRYDTESNLDPLFLDAIDKRQGAKGRLRIRSAFGRGSVLWVGYRDQLPAVFLWTRRGDRFDHWFIPLEPEDIVTFAMVTLPEHRGVGLAPTMMRHVIAVERGPGGRALIDSAVWNKPSIRAIEKVGYRPIGRMKPLPPERS